MKAIRKKTKSIKFLKFRFRKSDPFKTKKFVPNICKIIVEIKKTNKILKKAPGIIFFVTSRDMLFAISKLLAP